LAKARDSQRQRLYNAERTFGDFYRRANNLQTVGDITKWVEAIIRKRWFVELFRINAVTIRPGTRNRVFARGGARGTTAVLTLPTWARTEMIVLHELAHACTPASSVRAGHGVEYAGTYILLIEKVLGKEKADELRDAFRKGNVDWTMTHLKPRKVRQRPRAASSRRQVAV
jgi:putative metallohydrolase (TIGR04338 family)